jgi:hypothetical protein
MSSESVFSYGHGRQKYVFLAAAVFLTAVVVALAIYSISTFGVLSSMVAIIVLVMSLALPIIPLRAALDIRVSDELIGRCFDRLPLKSIQWSHVVHAMQVDVFHAGYGRVVRVYHLRTRKESVLPAIVFLDTIDNIELLLEKVNIALSQRDIAVWHKDDLHRKTISTFTLRAGAVLSESPTS